MSCRFVVKQIRLNAFHGEDLKWAFAGVLFVYWPAGVLAHRSDSVSESFEVLSGTLPLHVEWRRGTSRQGGILFLDLQELKGKS